MARKKREGMADRIKDEIKLDLTPMIDVTFLILIFFMVTLKFKTLEGKLVSYLPTDKGLSSAQQDVLIEDAEIILTVPKANGNWDRPQDQKEVVFLHRGNNTPLGKVVGMTVREGDEKNPTLHFEPADTMNRVREYLKRIRDTSEEAKAKINSDPRVPQIYVVRVLDLMMEARYVDISYSGIPERLIERLATGEVR